MICIVSYEEKSVGIIMDIRGLGERVSCLLFRDKRSWEYMGEQSWNNQAHVASSWKYVFNICDKSQKVLPIWMLVPIQCVVYILMGLKWMHKQYRKLYTLYAKFNCILNLIKVKVSSMHHLIR